MKKKTINVITEKRPDDKPRYLNVVIRDSERDRKPKFIDVQIVTVARQEPPLQRFIFVEKSQ